MTQSTLSPAIRRGPAAQPIALLVLVWAALHGTIHAADPVYSFILHSEAFASNPELSGISPNTIFQYNPDTDVAEPASTRLADALALLDPTALVDGMSYGFDICCLAFPHGDIHFSVRRTSTGASGAIPLTDVWWEPTDDLEADLFWVPHVPATGNQFFLPLKSMEENTHSPRPVRIRPPYFPYPRLGLHGLLGSPNGANPALSNLGAFDRHPATFASKTIYFSIDRPVGAFHPADILVLDSSGVISQWATRQQIGLGPNDDIDAVAVDVVHSAQVGQPALALFSISRESASATFSGGPVNAADVLMYIVGTVTPITGRVYRNAFAQGLSQPDGDIDTIISIDPLSEGIYIPRTATPVTIVTDTPTVAIPDCYDIEIRDTDTRASLGSSLTYSAVVDQAPGAYEPLVAYSAKGDRIRSVGGSIHRVTSSTPPVSGLGGTPLGVQSAQWTWTGPITATGFEVRLNGGPPMLLPISQTDFTAVDLLPGPNALEVRAFVGTSRSEPEFAQVFIESALPGVEDLTAQPVGFLELDFTFEQTITLDRVELRDGDQVIADVTTGAPGTYSVTVTVPNFGHRRYTAVGFLIDDPSYPTSIDTFVPRPVPGTPIQEGSLAGLATGITVNPIDQVVAVLDAATNTVQLRDLANLNLPVGSFPAPMPTPTAMPATGIAFDPMNPSYLYAIQSAPGGGSELWRTDLNGLNLSFVGPLALPAGITAGDICFTPEGDFLWVAGNGTPEYFGFTPTGGPAGLAPRTNPTGVTIGGGVACRPGDTILAPVEVDGPGVDLTALDANSDLRAFTPVGDVPLVGLRGYVWTPEGSLAVPSVFAIDAANNRVVEVAANEALPPEIDCHQAILGAERAVNPVPASIPDNDLVGLVSQLNVASGLVIGDLDLEVAIEHSRPTDLSIELTSPFGATVNIFARSQQYPEQITIRFDDLFDPGYSDGIGTKNPAGPGRLTDFDGSPVAGNWTLRVIDHEAGETGTLLAWGLRVCPEPPAPNFIRGDVSADGSVDISDAISLLSYIFSSGPRPPCLDSADANDDGGTNIGDAITILSVLFAGAPPFPPPTTCGPDPTPDFLDCASFPPCP